MSIENQIKKVYVCVSCGRKMRFAKHRDSCPSCGGTLIVKTVVEKKKGA